MRSSTFYILLLCAFLFSCDDDDYPYANIPSVVLNSFWTQFPDATDVEMRKAGPDYEVEFEMADNESAVLISSSGNILREKREISVNELPVMVRSSLETEHGEKKVDDPEIIRSGDQLYYQVQIKRLLMDDKLVLDKNGRPASSVGYWK